MDEPGDSPGRRERRRLRTREALLKAALSLIAQRGIEATRVEDITEAADLGKGAFYNYFESKQALVAELVGEGLDRLDREYLAHVPDATPPGRRASALARQHAAFFADHPSYLLLLHQARGLLQLPQRGTERLSAVFARYLARLGQRLLPAGAAAGWSEMERLQAAAALAGSVAGFRSFEIAAGLTGGADILDDLLTGGIERVLERRGDRGGGEASPV